MPSSVCDALHRQAASAGEEREGRGRDRATLLDRNHHLDSVSRRVEPYERPLLTLVILPSATPATQSPHHHLLVLQHRDQLVPQLLDHKANTSQGRPTGSSYTKLATWPARQSAGRRWEWRRRGLEKWGSLERAEYATWQQHALHTGRRDTRHCFERRRSSDVESQTCGVLESTESCAGAVS